MEAYGTKDDGADNAFESDRVAELLGDVPAAAERLWTSSKELRGDFDTPSAHMTLTLTQLTQLTSLSKLTYHLSPPVQLTQAPSSAPSSIRQSAPTTLPLSAMLPGSSEPLPSFMAGWR
jgi:hypothetical protein